MPVYITGCQLCSTINYLKLDRRHPAYRLAFCLFCSFSRRKRLQQDDIQRVEEACDMVSGAFAAVLRCCRVALLPCLAFFTAL